MENLDLAKNTVVGILKAGCKAEEFLGNTLKAIQNFTSTVQCTKNFERTQRNPRQFANCTKTNDSQNVQHHPSDR